MDVRLCAGMRRVMCQGSVGCGGRLKDDANAII